MSEVWSDPEYKKRVSLRIKEAQNNPENKERRSKQQKEYYSIPENYIKLMAMLLSPEAKKKRKRSLSLFYEEHPEARLAVSERMTLFWKENPDLLDMVVQSAKDYWNNPQNRKKQNVAKKELYTDPEFAQRMAKIREQFLYTPEVIEKTSVSLKAYYSIPENMIIIKL